MKFSSKKGFTLIEMLIVIAIIGILSAAVLAGLGPARNKAKDARIISGMNQVRSIAEAKYNPSSDVPYSAMVSADPIEPTDPDLIKIDDDIEAASAKKSTLTVLSDGTYYLAYALLLTNQNEWYCVDSAGTAGVVKDSAPQGQTCAIGGTP